MKNSIAVARQTEAAEAVANDVAEIKTQIAALIVKVDTLLEANATPERDDSKDKPTITAVADEAKSHAAHVARGRK